jgi:hypothetical protein
VTAQGQGRPQAASSWPLYLVGGVFVVSLGLMIWASVAPAPRGGFYLALGAFIGCSAAWVALQLTQAHRAPFPVVLTVGLLLLAAGIAGIAWHPDNRVTVAAWACAYLGIGFLVELLREEVYRRDWPFRLGLVFFVGGAAVILGVTIALLRGTKNGTFPLVMLGLCALVFVPTRLNVLSEKALAVRRSEDGEDGRKGRFQRRALPYLRDWQVWAIAGLVLSPCRS